MKAIELLKQDRDYCLAISIDNSIIKKYDDGIEEVEAYITNYQEMKRRLDSTVETLAVLTSTNKSMSKLLTKMNKKMIELRKENRELESRSCENCKHYKQSSSQDYKSCYEIKINGFNFESEKDFCCKYWELK